MISILPFQKLQAITSNRPQYRYETGRWRQIETGGIGVTARPDVAARLAIPDVSVNRGQGRPHHSEHIRKLHIWNLHIWIGRTDR